MSDKPADEVLRQSFSAGIAQLREATFVGVKEACPDIVKRFDDAIEGLQTKHLMTRAFWETLLYEAPCRESKEEKPGVLKSQLVPHPDLLLVMTLAETAMEIDITETLEKGSVIASAMEDILEGSKGASTDEADAIAERPDHSKHMLLVLRTARYRLAADDAPTRQ